MKKLAIYVFVGFIVGILGASFMLNGTNIDFSPYYQEIIITLYSLAVIFLIISLLYAKKIKKLSTMEVTGDAEDEADCLIYRKFSDFVLIGNVVLIIAIVALAFALIKSLSMLYVLTGIIIVFINAGYSIYSNKLIKYVYPDRDIPNASDPKYADKLLEISDEGERHVILHGLYKTFFVTNNALIFSIVFLTLYSIVTESSQLIGVVVLGVIYMLNNGNYILQIRNK